MCKEDTTAPSFDDDKKNILLKLSLLEFILPEEKFDEVKNTVLKMIRDAIERGKG